MNVEVNNNVTPTSTTRSSVNYGLSSVICKDDRLIKGCRLPTNGQILQYLLYHHQCEKKTLWDASVETLKQILPHYEKSNIPMSAENHV